MSGTSVINTVSITLDIGDAQALFILFTVDGAIYRQGTGAEDTEENDLIMGLTLDPTKNISAAL